MTSTAIWAAGIIVLVAALSDFIFRKIPNFLTLGGILVGALIQAAVGFVTTNNSVGGAFKGFGIALLGAIACAFIPFLAWKKGEMGGGDVKLFGALGAIMGPMMGFDVVALTFALTLLVLFPYRLFRKGVMKIALQNTATRVRNMFRNDEAKVALISAPTFKPVILAPTIAFAFFITLFRHGVIG
jgi:prepilin peptidase CpaA